MITPRGVAMYRSPDVVVRSLFVVLVLTACTPASTPPENIAVESAGGEATATTAPPGLVTTTTMAATTATEPGDQREPCVATLPDGSTEPVALVWQSGAESAVYLTQLDGANGAVNVVSPLWWRMRADGTMGGIADPGYVDAVHDRNVAVWPAVAGFDADTHHLVFSDPDARSALAAQISAGAREADADGVNIDIEGYRAQDAAGFLSWVEELTGLVHEWGGLVSYDLIPRSDTWEVTPAELSFWSTAPLREEVSAVTDCTVLMAYDQHNRFRPAGPVASPPWVEDVLAHALGHTSPDRLVLGMPFYGLVWEPAELESPRAVGLDEIDRLSAEGTASPDRALGIERVDLADGRFLWAETTDGLGHRFDLVAEHGLAGWAAWRFGFDHPGIWDLIGSR